MGGRLYRFCSDLSIKSFLRAVSSPRAPGPFSLQSPLSVLLRTPGLGTEPSLRRRCSPVRPLAVVVYIHMRAGCCSGREAPGWGLGLAVTLCLLRSALTRTRCPSPQRSDPQLLAQFYYADEELNQVAAELDSLDGRKDPQRCTLLVSQFRSCQVSSQVGGRPARVTWVRAACPCFPEALSPAHTPQGRPWRCWGHQTPAGRVGRC